MSGGRTEFIAFGLLFSFILALADIWLGLVGVVCTMAVGLAKLGRSVSKAPTTGSEPASGIPSGRAPEKETGG